MRALLRLLVSLPAWLQRSLSGGEVVVDGQRMDPPSQILNALIVRFGGAIEEGTPAEARAELARLKDSRPALEVEDIEDLPIDTSDITIRGRVYRPASPTGAGLVWLHGGGWVLGELDMYDYICSCLAARSGATVVSVEYRLAPEHRYPTAADDASAAFHQVHERADALGIDPERLAVGGDSAGGNLAAVVAQRALREGGPAPAFQLLVYPATDLTRESPSYAHFAEGFLLGRGAMRWFIDHYVPDPARRAEPDASPLLAEDLSGLPPAHVVVAGFDPLRDETFAYARRLEEAGVPVTVDPHPSTFHGFFTFGTLLPIGELAVDRAAEALRAALG